MRLQCCEKREEKKVSSSVVISSELKLNFSGDEGTVNHLFAGVSEIDAPLAPSLMSSPNWKSVKFLILLDSFVNFHFNENLPQRARSIPLWIPFKVIVVIILIIQSFIFSSRPQAQWVSSTRRLSVEYFRASLLCEMSRNQSCARGALRQQTRDEKWNHLYWQLNQALLMIQWIRRRRKKEEGEEK